MPNKVYRTAIYTRLSREDGDKAESNSIASQRVLCEEYIKNHSDLELVKTFVDDGWSGVNFDRPNFRLLEQDIRDGLIDCIICKDLSRFSRNYIEGGRYLEKIFPQLGIRFIAINDAYDSLTGNPQSDSFIIPFKNLMNETYCKDLSVKIRSHLDVKRRKGEYVGSFAPYGYRKAPDDKHRLVIDEYAGGIVQSIFGMYKEGMSISAIADRLNSMGVLSPMEYRLFLGDSYKTLFKTHSVAKWSYPAVRRILTNEVYLGVLVQGKRGRPNYKVRKVQPKKEHEWVVIEDTHDSLISHADFMAVKAMLGRDRRSCADKDNLCLFSGFLFCGDCNMTMVRKVVPSQKKKYVYYVCSSSKHGQCSQHSISEKELERVVLHAIQDQIALVLKLDEALAFIDKLPSADRQIFNFDTQIVHIEEEIEKLKARKLRLYEDLADGMIDKTEYMEFRDNYSQIISQKKDALARIQKERREAVACGVTERAWVSLFRKYENIEELNRRVMMALVDQIIVYENHVVEIEYKYRDEYEQAMQYVSMYQEDMAKAV